MRSCPLKSIEVENFKSIASGKVEFKPLTVLVGMNSSGKSSLLQAVRFLSQTAKAQKTGTEVPLNGTKIRLGTFDDARTVGTDGRVSFQAELVTGRHGNTDRNGVESQALLTLEVAEPDTRPDRGYAQIAANQIEVPSAAVLYCAEHWLNAIWDNVELAWTACWDPDIAHDPYMWDDTDQLWGSLKDAADAERAFNHADRSFVLVGADDIRRTFAGAFAGVDLRTDDEFLKDLWDSVIGVEDEASRDVILEFLVSRLFASSADESVSESLDPASTETLVGLVGRELGALLLEPAVQPPDLSGKEWLVRAFYQTQDAQLDAASASWGTPSSLNSDRLKRVIGVIQGRAHHYSDSEWAAMALSMIEVGGLWFVEDPEMDDEDPDTWPKTDTFKIAQLFVQECLEDEWAKDPVLRQRANRALADRWRPGVTELLQDRVRYLGPLRQEPRPYFDFGDESRPDVGAAGEHLSHVLQWHGTESVDVPGLGQADLVHGLQHWLRELGVVEDVTVEARGRAGVSIEVRPTDLDRQVDLTSVGVGVSQVLPVLAVCLLAEPGDIVLLEQPELHLHPALQMRLADFLLACVDSGRQIIVETHSEHLVNRLRRRAAEDGTRGTGELVRIVFSERDGEGHTSFRASDINPLGGLSEDWPDGFLDLGARDAQKLLQASLAKYRRQDGG